MGEHEHINLFKLSEVKLEAKDYGRVIDVVKEGGYFGQ